MGIPRLTRFIRENFEARWREIRVRDERHGLVIDGSPLCYNLYFQKHNWDMGGEYCEFYRTVLEYCEQLRSLGIRAYIVMDGIDFDDSKREKLEERQQQKLASLDRMQSEMARGIQTPAEVQVLPLFAKAVFNDAARAAVRASALQGFFVADEEADRDIVALANHLNCRVLGNDSDFFLFDIRNGYIPMLEDSNLVDLSGEVKCFVREDFTRMYHLSETQLLYLPFILGNDFHKKRPIRELDITFQTDVSQAITLVTTRESDISRYIRQSGEQTMRQIRVHYTVEDRSYAFLSSSDALLARFPLTPMWILDLYKQGKFLPRVLHMILSENKVWRHMVVIEDMNKESAWRVAQNALEYIIRLVLREQHCDADLMDRTGVELQPAPIEFREVLPMISLTGIRDFPNSARKGIIFSNFGCEDAVDQINLVEMPLKLVTIASRFWLNKDRGSNSRWVVALVSCILACFGSELPPCDGQSQLQGREKLAFIHTFAKWQCILHHVIILNQVLNVPFAEEVFSPRLFSAAVVLYYHNNPSQELSSTADALQLQRAIEFQSN